MKHERVNEHESATSTERAVKGESATVFERAT
jgi:hypothetical protein